MFLLFYSIAAVCLAFAGLAMLTRPDQVEMVGGGINQHEVVGHNSRLEVALAIGLHPNTCTRKVCRTNVCHLAIENHHLEMDSRTEPALQLLYESRILIKIFTEVRARLFGVQQSHLHTSPYEHIEHSKERLTIRADLHIEVFNICRTNHQRMPYTRHPRQHLIIVRSHARAA